MRLPMLAVSGLTMPWEHHRGRITRITPGPRLPRRMKLRWRTIPYDPHTHIDRHRTVMHGAYRRRRR